MYCGIKCILFTTGKLLPYLSQTQTCFKSCYTPETAEINAKRTIVKMSKLHYLG